MESVLTPLVGTSLMVNNEDTDPQTLGTSRLLTLFAMIFFVVPASYWVIDDPSHFPRYYLNWANMVTIITFGML